MTLKDLCLGVFIASLIGILAIVIIKPWKSEYKPIMVPLNYYTFSPNKVAEMIQMESGRLERGLKPEEIQRLMDRKAMGLEYPFPEDDWPTWFEDFNREARLIQKMGEKWERERLEKEKNK